MTVTNFLSGSPSSANSHDLVFGTNLTSGSTIIAAIRCGSTITVTAATTPGAQALTAIGPIDNGAGRQYIFYRENMGSGANTVRFSYSASTAPRICIAEITDALASSIDVNASNTNAGSTSLTGGATSTTAQAAEEWIGFFSIAANQTFSQNGSFPIVGVEPAAGSSRIALVHQTASGISTPNAAVDGNSSSAWIGQTVTFRIAGTSLPPGLGPGMHMEPTQTYPIGW